MLLSSANLRLRKFGFEVQIHESATQHNLGLVNIPHHSSPWKCCEYVHCSASGNFCFFVMGIMSDILFSMISTTWV
ncbi:hypothetical protein AAG906_011429 [Vitis piasezkii]